jgi:hypothetical protein
VLETVEAQLAANATRTEPVVKTESNELEEDGLDESKSLLYLELICLNSLLIIYKLNKQVNRSKLDESKFNIELLMQILQTKQETTTGEDQLTDAEDDEVVTTDSNRIDRLNVQQNILILLSEIASIFPDKVLEHVIIMFIFVGNKLARKDDAYSFQVINQVIKSILPSIVNSVQQHQLQQRPDSEETSGRLIKTIDVIQRHQKQLPYVSSLVCKILQSFVVSLPHMPAHRKTIIFAQLMRIVGLDDYLWITSIQSIDYYLVQSSDLLNFTNNLELLTTKQQQRLAANDNVNASGVDSVSRSEKKLRDTIKSCIGSMIALFVQFKPIDLIQSSVYLVTFLNKYITKLFESALKVTSAATPGSKIAKRFNLINEYYLLRCH